MLARSGLGGKNTSRPHLAQFQVNFPMDQKTAKTLDCLSIFLGEPMAAEAKTNGEEMKAALGAQQWIILGHMVHQRYAQCHVRPNVIRSWNDAARSESQASEMLRSCALHKHPCGIWVKFRQGTWVHTHPKGVHFGRISTSSPY